MTRRYFKSIENLSGDCELPLDEILIQLNYNEQHLIPVVTQDAISQKVLMLAWMNRNALSLTLATKRVTYWSRSRKKLWVKGETSGHVQSLVSLHIDCDGDALLCRVDQSGGACHTGRESCFFWEVDMLGRRVLINGSVGKSASEPSSLILVE